MSNTRLRILNRKFSDLLQLIALSSLLVACRSDSPESLARAYTDARDWRDRLALVLEPERVEPKMARKYANWRGEETNIESLSSTPGCQSAEGDQICIVTVTLIGKNAFGANIRDQWHIELRKAESGWRIDWEATVGWNDLTAVAFSAQRPTEPVLFRAYATLSDYYNYDFRDGRQQFISLELTTRDHSLPYGYIERASTAGKWVWESLKDGKPHKILVELKYLASSDGNVALVSNVLAVDSWQMPRSISKEPDRQATAIEAPTARDPLAALMVEGVRAHFNVASRGRTTIDGGLWVPEISVNIRNAGSTDVDAVFLRAVFMDSDKTLRGDPVLDRMVEIPAGYAKGPATLIGEVGYTSDLVFLRWRSQPELRWRFDLFIGPSATGPWSRVGGGLVDGLFGGDGVFVPEARSSSSSEVAPGNSVVTPYPSMPQATHALPLHPNQPPPPEPAIPEDLGHEPVPQSYPTSQTTQDEEITQFARASASSTLPPDSSMTFSASNVLDGALDTSWQPSAKKTRGVGEWIALDFPSPEHISRVDIANGYQTIWYGQDLFSMNARLNEIEIAASGRTLRYAFPSDGRGFVPVRIDPPVLTNRIMVRVISIHRGSRWPDVAVSEMRVFRKQARPAAPVAGANCSAYQGDYPFRTAVTEYKAAAWSRVSGRYTLTLSSNCDFELRKFGYDDVVYPAEQIQRATGRFAEAGSSPPRGTFELNLSSASDFELSVRFSFRIDSEGRIRGDWRYLGEDWDSLGLAGTLDGARR